MNRVESDQQAVLVVTRTVVLVTWSMLFATLFLCYFVLRMNISAWPPLEREVIPLKLPLISSIFILLSSIFLEETARKTSSVKRIYGFWILTLTSSLAFLVSQCSFWYLLQVNHIFTGTSIFSSLLYTFTWIHAFHIILGVFALTVRFFRQRREFYTAPLLTNRKKSLSVDFSILFWHFLTVIWMLMFLMLFVF
jgi:cytochrome c oxidase subunit 3